MNSDRQNKIFALISLISFGLFILLRDKNFIMRRSFLENLINLSFELVFFIPIVLLPIKTVEKKIIASLKRDKGLTIGGTISAISSCYYSLFYFLEFSDKTEHLIKIQNIFWSQLPWGVNLGLCYLLLIGLFRLSLTLMGKKASQKGLFTYSYIPALLPLGLLPIIFQDIKFIQPQIPLTMILIALFYGGDSKRLGREKFFYHFSFDYSKLTGFLGQSFLAVFILFVFSVLTGFVELNNFQTKDLAPEILFKNINVWFYYVGLAEEIIFKVLLLRLLADSFTYHHLKNPETLSLVVSAVIFGLAHAVKGIDYAFLAFLSSCVTGTFYLRYRGILGPIFFHMMLDVVAISLFQAPL